MASAVQYRGRKAILEGFDDAGIPAWALVYNKQIVGKCAGKPLAESREELDQLLKQLERSNTTAQYTLCLYEDIKDRRKIRISTEADISKNVLLFDSEDNPSPAYQRSQGMYSQLMDRMDTIDARLALITKDEEEDTDEEEGVGSKPSGIMGMIDRLLDNPRVQERVGEKLMYWMDKFFEPADQQPPKQISAMGSTGMNTTPITEVTQEQAQKIQDAVTILAGIDPKLGDNLMKIAEMAQTNSKKYFNAISMLNTFL